MRGGAQSGGAHPGDEVPRAGVHQALEYRAGGDLLEAGTSRIKPGQPVEGAGGAGPGGDEDVFALQGGQSTRRVVVGPPWSVLGAPHVRGVATVSDDGGADLRLVDRTGGGRAAADRTDAGVERGATGRECEGRLAAGGQPGDRVSAGAVEEAVDEWG